MDCFNYVTWYIEDTAKASFIQSFFFFFIAVVGVVVAVAKLYLVKKCWRYA